MKYCFAAHCILNAVKAVFRFLKILPLSYRGFDFLSAEFLWLYHSLPDLLIAGTYPHVSMTREASVCSDKQELRVAG